MTASSRAIKRNKQIRQIARSVGPQWQKATIHSVDGNRAHIRLGASSTLVKHVEIAGDGSYLAPGEEVAITWKDGRPVVLPNATNRALPKLPEEVAKPLAYYSTGDMLADIFPTYWGPVKTVGTRWDVAASNTRQYVYASLLVNDAVRILSAETDIRTAGNYGLYLSMQSGGTFFALRALWEGSVSTPGTIAMPFTRPLVLTTGTYFLHLYCQTAVLWWECENTVGSTGSDIQLRNLTRDNGATWVGNALPIVLSYQSAPILGAEY